eukprot:g54951.t1
MIICHLITKEDFNHDHDFYQDVRREGSYALPVLVYHRGKFSWNILKLITLSHDPCPDLQALRNDFEYGQSIQL